MPHREGLRRPRHLLLGLWVAVAVAALGGVDARAQLDAPPDDAGAKPIFLVADVVVGDGVPLEKDAARDVLATRFGRLKDKLEVRSMAEARATVDAVAMAQLMGSDNDADLARIEQYMQVDRLVLGRVTSIGGVIDVQVKVFNAKEGVTEVAFARRLGKNADRSLILTLLDTLADSLLAWTIENYTDGSMSSEATALQQKKLTGLKKPEPASAPSPWSALGVVGGVGIGVGAGLAAAGVYGLTVPTDPADGPVAFAAVGVGAGVAVLGAAMVVVDVVNGPPAE